MKSCFITESQVSHVWPMRNVGRPLVHAVAGANVPSRRAGERLREQNGGFDHEVGKIAAVLGASTVDQHLQRIQPRL